MTTTSFPIPLMSRSALEASGCPHRYKQIYVLGYQDDSLFSRRGTAFHRCVRLYIQRLVDLQLAGGDQEEADKAFLEGVRDVRLAPSLVHEVRDVFDRFTQNFDFNVGAYVHHEDRILRTEADVPYQFEPDLVYAHSDRNELEVPDWKTYYRTLPEAQVRQLVQTRYYIWAAMQEWPGFETYRFTMEFPRLNQKTSVVFKASDFAELDREVRAMDASRQALHEDRGEKAWPAIPGDECSFCGLDCPRLKDGQSGFVRVNDKASFDKVAQEKLAHEQRDKALTAALKGYVTINGPQNVNGEVFAHFPSMKRSYPAATVVDRMREKRMSPEFTVSASSLKKAFKDNAGLENDLMAVCDAKPSSRFSHTSEKKAAEKLGGDEDEE